MPLYEYRCQECERKFTYLVGMIADNPDPKCPRCGSKELKKLISRVARVRSEDEMLDSLTDPSKIGDLDDPAGLRRWARQMGKELSGEMGEDISEELEEMIEAEARGELGGEGSGDNAIY
jgi:putative FmdB family regulatory protein